MRATSAFRLPIGRWAAALRRSPRFVLPFGLLALAVFAAVQLVGGAGETVTTDKPSYFGTETVVIKGSGYASFQNLDIVVLTPTGSIFTADATDTTIPPAPYDTVTTNNPGKFTFDYQLNDYGGGTYTVEVYDSGDTLHTTILASATFVDPSIDILTLTYKNFGHGSPVDVTLIKTTGKAHLGLGGAAGDHGPISVAADGTIVVERDGPGHSIGSVTHLELKNSGGTILTVKMHTSCSVPIGVGFIYGPDGDDTADGAQSPGDTSDDFPPLTAGLEITGIVTSPDGCTGLVTPTPGTVIINKICVGGNDTFNYTGTGSGIAANFNITCVSGSGSQTFANIDPGAKSVTESTPPTGWTLTAISCDDGASTTPSTTNLGTATANIELDPGETVECTFTNTKDATITIVKDTDPEPDPTDFSFSGTCFAPFDLDDDANITLSNTKGPEVHATGSCTVIEDGPPAGWTLTGLVCSDPDSGTTTNTGTRTATIDLDPGENVTCTFTNTKDATITIVKDTDPEPDPTDFSFSGTCFAPFDLDDDANITLSNTKGPEVHATGSCTVIEDGPPAGWTLTGLVCSDPDSGTTTNTGTRTATIDLDPGENVTCTFTNTKDGNIIVDKVTDPSNDPQSFEFDPSYGANFFLTDTDTPNDSGLLAPGTYSVAEVNIAPGWTLTSATCTDGSPVNAIVLSAGETVTCTFTNTLTSTPTPTPCGPPVCVGGAVEFGGVSGGSELSPTTESSAGSASSQVYGLLAAAIAAALLLASGVWYARRRLLG